MSDIQNDDPLSALFVEGDSIDRELLARTLAPFVKIYMNKGKIEIVLTDGGNKLSAGRRLLVYLLARKAIVLRDDSLLEKEGMTPSELEYETHIPGGTIRPALKKLLDARLLQQSDEEGYHVPNYAIRDAHNELNKGE